MRKLWTCSILLSFDWKHPICTLGRIQLVEQNIWKQLRAGIFMFLRQGITEEEKLWQLLNSISVLPHSPQLLKAAVGSRIVQYFNTIRNSCELAKLWACLSRIGTCKYPHRRDQLRKYYNGSITSNNEMMKRKERRLNLTSRRWSSERPFEQVLKSKAMNIKAPPHT